MSFSGLNPNEVISNELSPDVIAQVEDGKTLLIDENGLARVIQLEDYADQIDYDREEIKTSNADFIGAAVCLSPLIVAGAWAAYQCAKKNINNINNYLSTMSRYCYHF